MLKRIVFVLVALLCVLALQLPAQADDSGDDGGFWSQVLDGKISGRARIYDYRQWHAYNAPYPGQSLATDADFQGTVAGGDILVRSGAVAGFSVGASLFEQQRLFHYASPNNLVPPLNQLAESYLQFQKSKVQIRFGRQIVNTPFAAADQFTLGTRSFYGTSASFHILDSKAPPPNSFKDTLPDDNPPTGFDPAVQLPFDYRAEPGPADLKLYFARMTRYLSRFASDFTDTNRYGTEQALEHPNADYRTPGLFTAGVQYQQGFDGGDLMARAWWYTFFDYAHLQFYELGYQAPQGSGKGPRPFAMLQYTTENEAGAAKLGKIQADYYGAKLGVNFSKGNVALVGQYAPQHQGTFRNGELAHPYTDLSGVLFDDTLNDGLENVGPGRAYGVRVETRPNKHFDGYVLLVHYVADYGTNGSTYTYDGPAEYSATGLVNNQLVPDQSSNDMDIGWTYEFGDLPDTLRGFSLGDDLIIRNGFGGRNRFVEDRFRLVYSF